MMTDRVRETTRLAQQREKMMALGKLSAGLAHELNNPATAVRRDADALDEQLARLPELTRQLLVARDRRPGAGARRSVAGVAGARERPRGAEAPPGALERSRLEQEIGDWLDERGVERELDAGRADRRRRASARRPAAG